jgi:hypothetical protein
MFGQSRRQAFLEATAPANDEPADLGPGIKYVQELMRDSKAIAPLLKQAADATAAIRTAQAALAELERAQTRAEQGVERANAEVDRIKADHDRRVAIREAELAARENRAQELEAKAVEQEAKAKSYRDEQIRRLQNVERAVQGNVA